MFVSTKGKQVGSTASVVTNSVLIISHITFRGCRVRISFSKVLAPLSLSRNAGRGGPGTCDIMFHNVLTESTRFPAAMRRGSF